MFNFCVYPPVKVESCVCIKADKFPSVIEGAEVFDLLCPVSSETGLRENPLSLLKSLLNDPAKSRALDAILMELPSVASPKGIDNDTLLELMQPVLSAGTFYEDDKFAERLLNISSDLLMTMGIDKVDNVTKQSPSVDDPKSSPTPAPAAE